MKSGRETMIMFPKLCDEKQQIINEMATALRSATVAVAQFLDIAKSYIQLVATPFG
jgi:hypothetical protein